MGTAEARRVAALYDVHGNLPALEAALDAAEAASADVILFGGDIALGPMPRETIDRVRALGRRAYCIRGNCDRLMVDACDGRSLDRLPPAVREPIVWAGRQLDRAHRDFLASLPLTLAIAVEGIGEVLFCHATPRSDEEVFTKRTPDERVRPMLEGVTQPLVVCGHSHMQFDRRVGGTRIVNAGSVGMPFAPPGAYWLLLGPDVRATRTDYDLVRTAELVRATSYPQADVFLKPYSEEEALRLFEPAAVAGEE